MVDERRSDAPEEDTIFMTQEEFVTLTGLSRSTICRWVKDGTLPVFSPPGGRKKIRRDLAMAWIDQHSSGGKAP